MTKIEQLLNDIMKHMLKLEYPSGSEAAKIKNEILKDLVDMMTKCAKDGSNEAD